MEPTIEQLHAREQRLAELLCLADADYWCMWNEGFLCIQEALEQIKAEQIKAQKR